ncbi:MAG: tetratricopeptide repeat protein [Candidatus Krumholzibacteriales bacterium]
MSNFDFSRISAIQLTVLTLFLAGLLCSCEEKTVVEKVAEEYRKGNYREAAFLVRHHIYKGGEPAPELLFYAGRSLLKLGIEGEAEDYFSQLYSADSSWAPRIAGMYKKIAMDYLQEGNTGRGRQYIRRTLLYDRSADFGQYNNIAGKVLLEQGEPDEASVYLEEYISDYPDSAGAAEVLLDLSSAYREAGEYTRAIEGYRQLIDRYPRSRLVSTARWNFEELSIREAGKAMEAGELEAARNILAPLTSSSSSNLIRVRAHFMLGEICREQGFIGRAVSNYKQVLRLNLGSSGRYAERAKERIEQLDKLR